MNNKKSMIAIILILLIIFFSGCFLIKNNDNLSNTDDNSSNSNLSNIYSSIGNVENNATEIKDISNQNSSSVNPYNHQNEKKSKTNSSKLSDNEIREAALKGIVWDDGHGGDTQDVRIGKIYKSKNGLCLVPAFDKKTGKFLGAVWMGYDGGGGFFGGVDSYQEYKKIVSPNKTKHTSKNSVDNSKSSKQIVKNKSKTNTTSKSKNEVQITRYG